MSFRNPVTTIDRVTDPVTVAGGTVTSVTDPVTAGGGHIDTAGTVGSVLGDVLGTVAAVEAAVAVASGHVDTAGTVGSVTDPVTAGGGTVDSVTGAVGSVTGAVGSVTAAVAVASGHVDTAGVVGSVTGAVGSVTAAVAVASGHVDTAGVVTSVTETVTATTAGGTVDLVTTVTTTENSPQQGQDIFVWPAVSGESFAPTRGSGTVYSAGGGLPAYKNPSSTTTVTFPLVGRVNAAGKETVTIVGSLSCAAPTGSSPGPIVSLGHGSAYTTDLAIMFKRHSTGVGTDVAVRGVDGTISAYTWLNEGGGIGATHTYAWEITLNPDGSVTATITSDGHSATIASANTAAAPLDSPVTIAPCSLSVMNGQPVFAQTLAYS